MLFEESRDALELGEKSNGDASTRLAPVEAQGFRQVGFGASVD